MAVGGRNGTMVLPANRTYTPTNVYVVTPGYQSVPSSTYYAPY